MYGHRQIMEALCVISEQVHINHHILKVLLKHSKVEIPPELIKAGEELGVKTKALQAALDAQASTTPKQKEE